MGQKSDKAIIFSGFPVVGATGPIIDFDGVIPDYIGGWFEPSADATFSDTAGPLGIFEVSPSGNFSGPAGNGYDRLVVGPATQPFTWPGAGSASANPPAPPVYWPFTLGGLLVASAPSIQPFGNYVPFIFKYGRFTVTNALLATGTVKLSLFWR